MRLTKKFLHGLLVVVLAATPMCVAQSAQSKLSDPFNGKGFSSYTSFEQTHDSVSNWSSVVDSSMTYDFNKHFGISLGVPFYLAYNQISSSTTTTNGTTTTTQTALKGSNALGDMRFAMKLSTPTPIIRYAMMLTGTAPTGNTSTGISTGRVNVDFNNRFEYDLGRLTPLAELGVANSNTLINSYIKRPYSTLGAMPHFKGGAAIELVKNFSVEFSGYENLPVGLQKLYSHLYGSKTVTTVKTGKNAYQQGSVVTGNGISEDNGFSTGINTTLHNHVDFSITYDHSVAQKLDTVAFSMGFRIGRNSSK